MSNKKIVAAAKKAAAIRYEFRNGAHIKGATAQTVAEEVTRIAIDRGGLSAHVLVSESRPKGSPLHPCFEWDDSLAGEQFREHQARNIIKSVRVINDGKTSPLIAYCPKVESDERGETDYKLTSVVIERPDYYAQALTELVRRVKSAQEAVEQLQHAAMENSEQDENRLASIHMAIAALQTAGAAVRSLH